ncbi:MAG TPA: alpha-1,4-glucan--maltose-1-phosphate maltosyltransferase [Terriglobales bacterium]|nr:alpha-1,4-glucan--maltose-1-phosphate maltosyltransferase [Terriglobales bacterium]
MPEKTAIGGVGKPLPATPSAGESYLASLRDWPSRVVIEEVRPQIDGGRFPIKRIVGEAVEVTADIFADGHDQISAQLLFRDEGAGWQGVPMSLLENDRWSATFVPQRLGQAYYTVEAWVDYFRTWRDGFQKKVDAGQDLTIEFLIGADHVRKAAERARGRDQQSLSHWHEELRNPRSSRDFKAGLALDAELLRLMERYPDRRAAQRFERELAVTVDPQRAGFSAWYEFFPRSVSTKPGKHGTLRDAAQHLAYVAEMGFDVVYLPPIHPVGSAFRKGKNNNPQSTAEEVGSPWAIGSAEGGHTAVHPDLGTLNDFDELVARAKELHLDVALDIAFQASPDHPYVKEHPDWFRWRPDKTVQYAENPPKKYQDIYPFEFENSDWRALWAELRDVFLFWIGHGVRIFRVDNPHTKPFVFWEWLIAEVKAKHPEVIFLAEAFTRPKIMYRLAKLGFTQSYTYFAWRNNKVELTDYLRELTQTEVREYFRPNFWPNTPDILTDELQSGERGAFISRIVLAATLSPNYGIYGPAYELMEHVAVSPGKEEYLDSEKYEIKDWPLGRPDSLKPLIARLNAARKQNPALHSNHTLEFLDVDNHQLIAYAKTSLDGSNVIVAVVNLDPRWTQSGWLSLPLSDLNIDATRPYIVQELLSGSRYEWFGPVNYVELSPTKINAHIFRLVQGE